MPVAMSKRKRDIADQGNAPVAPVPPNFAQSSNFEAQFLHHDEGDLGSIAQALTQHNDDVPRKGQTASGGGHHAHDTAHPALQLNQDTSFLEQAAVDNGDASHEPDFDIESPTSPAAPAYSAEPPKSPSQAPNDKQVSPSAPAEDGDVSPSASPSKDSRNNNNNNNNIKPGSDEWQKNRRNNHKEVERRRRETINEGINELGKIVPGNERNKGSILHRAVTYINELKDEIKDLEKKHTLENMMFEQTTRTFEHAAEQFKVEKQALEGEVRRLKEEMDRLRRRKGVEAGPGPAK